MICNHVNLEYRALGLVTVRDELALKIASLGKGGTDLAEAERLARHLRRHRHKAPVF